MKSEPSYWDQAAADYCTGRETFPVDGGKRWRSEGSLCVGAHDLGKLDRRVLVELGCGHGTALRALAAAFPRGIFCGLDFSAGQLELAKQESLDLANVRYLLWDARLGLPQGLSPFDDLLSVYGALDFSADPSSMLDAFLAGLRPEGMCSILTSVEHVFDVTVQHPRLNVQRIKTLGSHRFVRARLTP